MKQDALAGISVAGLLLPSAIAYAADARMRERSCWAITWDARGRRFFRLIGYRGRRGKK
jgi:hypothetical protein